MIKWIFLFYIFLVGQRAFCQPPNGRDTLAFSFSLTDWHLGDTVYLHTSAPLTILHFFQKNIRLNDEGGSLVTGQAILYFTVDSNGRYVGSCYDETTNNPELALEVMAVADRMNKFLPMEPTRVKGKPVVSLVQLKVLFWETGKLYIGAFRPDITVTVSPPIY